MGGENALSRNIGQRHSGTSPRGWGKLRINGTAHFPRRNIPTWVGKTASIPCRRCRSAEHPHVGGENRSVRQCQPSRGGTSPRGWGKRTPMKKILLILRNIPTWVGKTVPAPLRWRGSAEHPHVGGENLQAGCENINTNGTSPRGWGKHSRLTARPWRNRNIPTWVGKTLPPSPSSEGSSEHPHVGGENSEDRLSDTTAIGTSPRGWGKQQHFVSEVNLIYKILYCQRSGSCVSSHFSAIRCSPA